MAKLHDTPPIGATSGRLTVIVPPFRKGGKTYVRCQCSCGSELEIRRDSFIDQKPQSCGCRIPKPYFNWPVIGTVSGLLTAIGQPSRRGQYTYLRCRCACGNEKDIRRDHFIDDSRSCGCQEGFQRVLERGIAARNKTLLGYKKQAKKRGFEWSLTDNEAIDMMARDCHYCGAPPNGVTKSGVNNGHFTYNGLDRQDNRLGYTPSNVVPCCAMCNHAKAAHPVEAFEAWIDRLIQHRR